MRERIIRLLQHYNINQTEFAQRIGVSKGMVSHVMSPSGRGSSFTETTIDNILSAFPDINKEWLLTGNGDMLKAVNRNNSVNHVAVQPSFDLFSVNNDDSPVDSSLLSDESMSDNNHSNVVRDSNISSQLSEEKEVSHDKNRSYHEPSSRRESAAPAISKTIENNENAGKIVSKIVVFYTDGSFSLYKPDTLNY